MRLERLVGEGDRLATLHRVYVRHRYTSLEVDYAVAYAWTFRDGKVVAFRSFRDLVDAMAGAGLSPG